LLEGALGLRAEAVQYEVASSVRPDQVLRAGDLVFAVEWKAAGDAANVGSAVRQLKAFAQAWKERRRPRGLVPIVAVPFMGETGRRLCAEAGVSWVDLSGNAWIEAPGRQTRILGNKNQFTSVGRPADVFASKSSRVIRKLLLEPQKVFNQTELASASGVDKGRVSRLVPRLEALGLVERQGRGIRVKDPMLALEAWREAYDFEKHDVRRGHVAVRDPEELIARVAESAESAGLAWALTGLAAAWRMTHFAMFRLVTVYVGARPSDEWLNSLGFREESRGANLWIVRPVDDAVFWQTGLLERRPCVHPLQVYLDLKAQPERASEAAAELRKRLLDQAA
jgi:hypothetical protein